MAESRRIVLPARIAVTVAFAGATAGCPPPAPLDGGGESGVFDALSDILVDGAPEAQADATSVDSAACDALPVPPFPPGTLTCVPDWRADGRAACPGGYFCGAVACGAGCEACPVSELGVFGVACVSDPRADASRACPERRVCRAGDCPVGCTACADALFCIPDVNSDGAVANCNPPLACDPGGCQPGCRAVG